MAGLFVFTLLNVNRFPSAIGCLLHINSSVSLVVILLSYYTSCLWGRGVGKLAYHFEIQLNDNTRLSYNL